VRATLAALPRLTFPLRRAEALASLHLPVGAGGTRSTIPNDLSWRGDVETIHLTDPDRKGTHYTLHLFFGPEAWGLSGDAFVAAKIVRYADILVEDDGMSGEPKNSHTIPGKKVE
jgi:hypothetical protein